MQPFFCRLIPKPKIDPNNFVAPNAQNIKNTEVLETVPLLFGHKGFTPYIYVHASTQSACPNYPHLVGSLGIQDRQQNICHSEEAPHDYKVVFQSEYLSEGEIKAIDRPLEGVIRFIPQLCNWLLKLFCFSAYPELYLVKEDVVVHSTSMAGKQ